MPCDNSLQNSGEIETLSPTNNRNSTKKDLNEKTHKIDATRVKASKSREMGDLEKNEILPSRLRSISGRVYSTGMVIDSPAQSTVQIETVTTLPSVSEDSELAEEIEQLTMQKPCSDSECCKNTAKIVNLITKLQQSVDDIKETNSRQTNFTAGISQGLREVEDKVEDNQNDILALKRELKEYRFQLKLVSNVVIRQDQQISVLNRKLNDAQQREMFSNIVITGIPESANENVLQKFNHFVSDNLHIPELIPAHRAYRIGTGDNRPILVELRDPLNYKPKIYAQVTKLKGQRNAHGGGYFVSDHLPEEYNENRRRQNELFAENKKKDPAKKVNMSIKRGRLLIDDQEYEKKIQPPKPRDILYPDEKLFDLADEIDMVKGYDQIHNKSRFIAYAAAIKDYKDVEAAYSKVRMKFADATHVTCAYRIPGDETYNLQDYADDGEIGAGRTLLGTLKQEATLNVVVFLIRYYGGHHLGSQRFQVFRDAAKGALKALRARIDQYKKEEAEQKAQEEKRQKELGSGWEVPAPPQEEDWSSAKKTE